MMVEKQVTSTIEKEIVCKRHDEEPITITNYLLSVFHNYFGTDTHHKKSSNKFIRPDGLMPHSPTRKTDASITPQTVTAPITMPSGSHDDDDCCWDYLSKSDSSASSSGSSLSSVSIHHHQHHNRQRRSVSSLSEILCEHYVQKTLNSHSHHESSDVPLETYKVFEASRKTSSHPTPASSLEEEEEEENWFIWDNLKKTREWIQVVDEELFLPKEKVTTEITSTIAATEPNDKKRVRSIRSNPAHLRMIVAEVNMMRCDKIVGPLRSRGFLGPRTDIFISNQSSPLRLPIL